MSNHNQPGKVEDTGHTWDTNLRELVNDPPRWWMISFWASIAWVIIYFILYPALPMVSGYTKGVMGWTQISEYKQALDTIEEVRAPYENRIKGMSAAGILADRELTQYTVRSAKVLFGDRCAPCHGAGGAGNPGYPVLADDDWLYGGSVETIHSTISNGRKGVMPGFGSALSEQQIEDLAKHVVAMSEGGEYGPGMDLFLGAGCIACHGMDGKGLQAVGGANLTDAIWRFAPGGVESAKYTITHGVNSGTPEARMAEMPNFASQLSEAEITKLTVYVHQLGGGQ